MMRHTELPVQILVIGVTVHDPDGIPLTTV